MTIVCDFKPRFVLIVSNYITPSSGLVYNFLTNFKDTISTGTSEADANYSLFWCDAMGDSISITAYKGSGATSTNGIIRVNVSDSSFRVYTSQKGDYYRSYPPSSLQMNVGGRTYTYIILG